MFSVVAVSSVESQELWCLITNGALLLQVLGDTCRCKFFFVAIQRDPRFPSAVLLWITDQVIMPSDNGVTETEKPSKRKQEKLQVEKYS